MSAIPTCLTFKALFGLALRQTTGLVASLLELAGLNWRVAFAARLNATDRAHWSIENSLRWVLDVTMNEDATRNRKDHGPENPAMLRRMALNFARLEGAKGSMKGKLKRAGWDEAFLINIRKAGSAHMR